MRSRPWTTPASASASLRVTSLVLVFGVAAPLVQAPDAQLFGDYQRPVFGGLLLLASQFGEHYGDTQVRTFDAVYTLLVGGLSVWLFSMGGVDAQGKQAAHEARQRAVRRSATMLSGALLFYASARQMRAGLRHAFEARTTRSWGPSCTIPRPLKHTATRLRRPTPRFTSCSAPRLESAPRS